MSDTSEWPNKWNRFKNGVQAAPTKEWGHMDAMNTLWWDNRVLPDGLMAWPRGAEEIEETDDAYAVRMANGDVYRIERIK